MSLEDRLRGFESGSLGSEEVKAGEFFESVGGRVTEIGEERLGRRSE